MKPAKQREKHDPQEYCQPGSPGKCDRQRPNDRQEQKNKQQAVSQAFASLENTSHDKRRGHRKIRSQTVRRFKPRRRARARLDHMPQENILIGQIVLDQTVKHRRAESQQKYSKKYVNMLSRRKGFNDKKIHNKPFQCLCQEIGQGLLPKRAAQRGNDTNRTEKKDWFIQRRRG